MLVDDQPPSEPLLDPNVTPNLRNSKHARCRLRQSSCEVCSALGMNLREIVNACKNLLTTESTERHGQ